VEEGHEIYSVAARGDDDDDDDDDDVMINTA
jgi:hypothetical protein